MRFIFVFCIFSVMLLCVNIFPLLAKAPTTPKILFTSARDGNRDVYIMNPDGSEQMNLTHHPANDLHAVWSPTGEQILFISDRGDDVRDLYLMDPDGSNVQRVFKDELKGTYYRDYPTWSPDGKQIAYMHINWDKDIYTIHIVNLEKEEEDFFANCWYPAWSPDGVEIACSAEGFRITLINVRTGAKKRILPRKVLGGQVRPSWSVIGDKLAFSWNNNPLPPDHRPGIDDLPRAWVGKQTIYIVNRDGTGLKQLVDEAGPKAVTPVLSPSGDEVLYTQRIKDRLQIFKLDINRGVQTQLTHIVGLSLSQANSGGDWFDPAYALPVSPQPELLTTTWGEVKQR